MSDTDSGLSPGSSIDDLRPEYCDFTIEEISSYFDKAALTRVLETGVPEIYEGGNPYSLIVERRGRSSYFLSVTCMPRIYPLRRTRTFNPIIFGIKIEELDIKTKRNIVVSCSHELSLPRYPIQ